VFKNIYEIVGHNMYIIDILVCGPHGNFQNKICLDMGVCFFCEGVSVSVYFCFCGCVFFFTWEWVCVFYYYLCVCVFFKKKT
jgi:hypothetical protein